MEPPHHHSPAVPKLSHQQHGRKTNLLLKEVALPQETSRAHKNLIFFFFSFYSSDLQCLLFGHFLTETLQFYSPFLLQSFTLLYL